MKSNLLTTKLYRPSAPLKRTLRPQLLQRLNQGLSNGRQITLISAPAGFGKTTCASEWVSALDVPVAWLSLDTSDNDPVHFFSYVIAALQRVKSALGRDIEGALSAGQLPPGEVITATLINDILTVDRQFLLVLDDFHVIQENSILEAVTKFITNQPPQIHLVLVTREDPLLPLARLRANNRMTEIRAGDLRFSRDEANDFLNAMMNLSLSEEDVAALENATEGWIAGLQLAAIAIQSPSPARERQDPSRFIAAVSGSHRYILSYLTEEVLSRQTEEVQSFLLQTAILERFTGDLCDAVTGRSDSRELLERLVNVNLFLVPLDDEQRWYRYHHLFADLLRSQVRGENAAGLHVKASQWYEQAGMAGEAIEHALAGSDYPRAVRLLELHAQAMVNQGYAKTVEGWMQAIPEALQSQSIRANLAFAWMHLLRGSYRQMAPYLKVAEAGISEIESSAGTDEEKNNQAKALRAEILALQSALLSVQGKRAESLEMARQALELAHPTDNNVRGLAYFRLAGGYREAGDPARAVEAYQQAIQNSRAAGNLVSEMLAVAQLALMAYQNGQLRFAAEICSQAVDRLERDGVAAPIAGAVYGALGNVYYEWNEFEKAHRYFQRGSQLSVTGGHNAAVVYIKAATARLLQAERNPETAFRMIQEASDLLQFGAPAWLSPEIVDLQVRIYLDQNKPMLADMLLQQHGITDGDADLVSKVEPTSELLCLAYLRLAAYRLRSEERSARQDTDGTTCITVANRLVEFALQGQRMGVALKALLLRALIQSASGNLPASLDDLEQALRMAEPEGYIRTFVDEGAPMLRLLEQCKRRSDSGYVRRLLHAFSTIGEDSSMEPETEPHFQPPVPQKRVVPVEALTERELDVLRLMVEGLKYEEMAERLVISLNTVRFYVKGIYSKLGVNNRTKAIAAARSLGLI